MPAYILRRLIGLIPVLFGISLMVFSFVTLFILYASNRRVTPLNT